MSTPDPAACFVCGGEEHGPYGREGHRYWSNADAWRLVPYRPGPPAPGSREEWIARAYGVE